jgi:hypothetical protein
MSYFLTITNNSGMTNMQTLVKGEILPPSNNGPEKLHNYKIMQYAKQFIIKLKHNLMRTGLNALCLA